MKKLQNELKDKNEIIRDLESKLLELKEKLEEQQQSQTETMKDKKTYGLSMRMLVYDSIINNVPTESIPQVIERK